MGAGRHGVERAEQEEVLLGVRLAFAHGQAVGDLGQGARAGVGLVGGRDRPPVGGEGRRLGDDVQAAPLVELDVDHGEGLQARPEP